MRYADDALFFSCLFLVSNSVVVFLYLSVLLLLEALWNITFNIF